MSGLWEIGSAIRSRRALMAMAGLPVMGFATSCPPAAGDVSVSTSARIELHVKPRVEFRQGGAEAPGALGQLCLRHLPARNYRVFIFKDSASAGPMIKVKGGGVSSCLPMPIAADAAHILVVAE
ncbi:hypothetical protein [Microbulbifer discodermiae]|uniref:hypothetical protein n=1 Tax=Microbulbifer sp. 2201CG32-9 TaxID=3232309 RepID=UPI00345B7688